MAKPRVHIDLDRDLPFDKERIKKFRKEIAPHIFVALDATFDDLGEDVPFDRDDLNITIHYHESTERLACSKCNDTFAVDEIY